MNDDILSEAKHRISEIMSQISDLESEHENLLNFVTTYKTLSDNLSDGSKSSAPPNGSEAHQLAHIRDEAAQSTAFSSKYRPGTFKDKVIKATYQALSDGRNMRTRELIGWLKQQGIRSKAEDEQTAISVILSTSKLFLPDRKHGWSIKNANHDYPDIL